MLSYSQAGQDLFVLSKVDKGTYLEIGASHPVNISNSYLLELNGWDGISVEIDPMNFAEWQKVRKNPLIIADALALNYWFLPGRVDYLQLDIEPGINTLAVLKRLPLQTTRFTVITFEHDRYLEGDHVRDEQRKILSYHGYELARPDVEYNGQQFEDWWIDPLYFRNA